MSPMQSQVALSAASSAATRRQAASLASKPTAPAACYCGNVLCCAVHGDECSSVIMALNGVVSLSRLTPAALYDRPEQDSAHAATETRCTCSKVCLLLLLMPCGAQ